MDITVYYGYPYYWAAPDSGAKVIYPGTTLTGMDAQYFDGYQGYLRTPAADDGDPHLRSCNAVKGYHLIASDGEIGHVDGFLLDDRTWSIRFVRVIPAMLTLDAQKDSTFPSRLLDLLPA